MRTPHPHAALHHESDEGREGHKVCSSGRGTHGCRGRGRLASQPSTHALHHESEEGHAGDEVAPGILGGLRYDGGGPLSSTTESLFMKRTAEGASEGGALNPPSLSRKEGCARVLSRQARTQLFPVAVNTPALSKVRTRTSLPRCNTDSKQVLGFQQVWKFHAHVK